MSGIRDTATVTLNVNGAQAKQMMSDIEQKISDTKKKISDLKANMADPKEIQKARKELKSYEKQLDDIKSATEGVENALNNLDSATPRQLEKALRTLNKQLKDMPPGSETWDSHIEKIKELKERIAELRNETNEQETLWDKFKDWATGAWPAIDLLNQWGGSFVDLARSAVDAFASMDQEMANVRKFTGMTEEQIEELNEAFKNMDTRTSREDLNKLAQEAGRLGKTSQEDVLGFVRAADKINVALDDLGDGATLTLSKLTGIFGDEKIYGTEQALLKVGSVINELSQNCSASAPYLAEFASRMGGVGSQAGMTIQQIMGFAAVLDSNEQKVEASATALSQVIVRMMQDPAKYAKVAGLEVQSFSKMLKEDANGALIMFLETLQKAGGMDVLSPMFKDMGENGSRAISALSTLATHIEEVKAQQEAANDAFREGISIDNEFDVQNTTVQAGLEKCAKAAQEIRVELGQKLQPVVSHLLTSTSAFMRTLLTVIKYISENKDSVIAITAAIAGYIIALNLSTIATKAATVATKGWHTATLLASKIFQPFRIVLTAVINTIQYFTNGLQVNYAMQERWRKSMQAMNFASWTGLILTVAAAVYTLANRWKSAKEEAEKARKEQEEYKKSLTDIDEASSEFCAKEVARLEELYRKATDETKSKEERTKATERLQALYPDYFKNLSTEEIMVGKAKTAYDNLRNSIIEVARARAAAEKIKDNEKKLLTLEGQEADLKAKRDKDKAAHDKAVKEWNDARAMESNQNYTNSTDAAAGQMVNVAPYANKVASTGKTYEASNSAYQNNLTQQKQLKDANAYLEKKYNTTVAALDDGEPSFTIPTGGGHGGSGGSGSSATVDKFAKEKEWRDQMEASARISYATGESDYLQYTKRMDEIAVQFYEKQLLHTDLSETERLKITADWREAQKKSQEDSNKETIEAENNRYNEEMSILKQFYIDGSISKETFESKSEEQEILHQKNLVAATKAGSKERLQAEQQLQSLLIAQTQRKQQEREKLEAEYSKMKKDYFGDNPEESKKKLDADLDMLKIVYEREIKAAGDNAAEKLRIDEAYEKAKLALKKKYGLLAEEDTRNAMEKGIAKSVEWLNGEGGKALTGTLDTLVSGMSAVFTQLSSLMQAELEIQTAAINKRYDAEIDRAQGNSYRIRTLEKQRDAEQAKAKKEANRKMFALQVIQAVAQTATNALNAYGSAAAVPVIGYILAPIAAAMAVAAGAIQIAAIKKQQQASEAQGYSKGGFTKPGAVDEPAGIVHAGEWVASQKLLANPVARPMIEALDYAQRTNTIGSLRDADVSRSIRATDSMVRMAESDGSSALMVAAIAHNAEIMSSLNERLKYPIDAAVSIAGDHGVAQAEDKYKMYLKNKSPKKFLK